MFGWFRKIRLFLRLAALLIALVQSLFCFAFGKLAPKDEPTAAAYLAVFQHFFSPRDYNYTYLAVDLSGVMYENPDEIKELIEKYMEGSSLTLLWDDFDGLIEGGYIVLHECDDGYIDARFEDGTRFSYHDVELTEKKLVTDAGTWSGDLCGMGGTYTAEKIRGKWVCEEPDKIWVS